MYKPEDRDVARSLGVAGHLASADAVTQPFMYERAVYWGEVVKRFYEDVPANINVKNGGCLFSAVDTKDGTLIGTIGLAVSDEDKKSRRAELMRMVVAPDRRGEGIGKLLLAFIIEYAKVKLKCRSIRLMTNSLFAAAVHLYEKYGFVNVGAKRMGDAQSSVDFKWVYELEKQLQFVQ